MSLADRLMGILSDGRRRSLPALSGLTGESVGDVRAALTTAWGQGAELDAVPHMGRRDWIWWRTDVDPAYDDLALLHAASLLAPGFASADLAAILRVTRHKASARLRIARGHGYIAATGRGTATRYHLTAAGRAELEAP